MRLAVIIYDEDPHRFTTRRELFWRQKGTQFVERGRCYPAACYCHTQVKLVGVLAFSLLKNPNTRLALLLYPSTRKFTPLSQANFYPRCINTTPPTKQNPNDSQLRNAKIHRVPNCFHLENLALSMGMSIYNRKVHIG